MQIAELLSGLKYNTFGVNLRGHVQSVASDSRKVSFGCLFICIKGSRRDGHDFAEEAMKCGAVAVVSERYITGVPCIVVKDTRVADAVIWDNYYGNPARKMLMVAVTGTNGKTSTAAYLTAALCRSGIRTASLGTLGCIFEEENIPCEGTEVTDIPAAMTTPDPEFLYKTLRELLQMGADAVVMEASSHAIAQKKLYPLRFECGVFTNLSPEHLDFHDGMEDYYKTKASLFEKCRHAVVGCDCGYGRRLAKELGDNAVRAEREQAMRLTMDENGVSYELMLREKKIGIVSPSPGFFTVQNTMLAAKAAYILGALPEKISEGIASVRAVAGRMERIEECEAYGFHVYIDYAHTPEALASAIRCVKGIAGGRKLTVVFGCGGDRDRTKRPEMGRIASELCDRVIVTSDNPRTERREAIIGDILFGIKQRGGVRVIVERKSALIYSVMTAKKDEFILLCGKGHESYETDGEGKHPFSEKDIVISALSRRHAVDPGR